RIGDGHRGKGGIAVIGGHDRVVDDLADRVVRGLGGDLGDPEVGRSDERRVGNGGGVGGPAGAVVDAGLVRVVAGIDVGLGDRVGRVLVQQETAYEMAT